MMIRPIVECTMTCIYNWHDCCTKTNITIDDLKCQDFIPDDLEVEG